MLRRSEVGSPSLTMRAGSEEPEYVCDCAGTSRWKGGCCAVHAATRSETRSMTRCRAVWAVSRTRPGCHTRTTAAE